MATIAFDTLKFADTLKAAGVPSAQSEVSAVANAIGEVDVATKRDLEALELHMTVKFGAMLAAAVGIIIAALRFPH